LPSDTEAVPAGPRRAFVVAAPWSGAGKTTITLGVLAALRARGLSVQAFKAGPDYIDPAHHARVTGRASHNLDTWMIPEAANRRIFFGASRGCDVAVVEGVMGLFDGASGSGPEGSTAHLAALLGIPVVLVVDVRSMARTAAALVGGLAGFDPSVRVAGVIWNRVGSPGHRRLLDEALEAAGFPPALGAFPREAALAVPERHLGLVTPEDAGLAADWAERLAARAEAHIDLDELLHRTAFRGAGSAAPQQAVRLLRCRRIAVARDAAFCFYYEENLAVLRRAGAEIVCFAPLEGDGVPPDVHGVYLGGGYPEVHARRLARNQAFLEGLRELHGRGVPIYAECGGFMALCAELEDVEGRVYPMAGVFRARVRMRRNRFRLGYREVEVTGLPGLEGLRARGHEFHYSDLVAPPAGARAAYRVRSARGEPLGREGYRMGSALGSYIHLHFASCPALPLRWFGPEVVHE